MEKNVVVCDVCSENLAKQKCEVCGKDLCVNCSSAKFIVFTSQYGISVNPKDKKFILCKKCMEIDFVSDETIRNLVLEKLKKGAILKELEPKEVQKEESIKKYPQLFRTPLFQKISDDMRINNLSKQVGGKK